MNGFQFHYILSMRVIHKKCPTYQNDFEAKRKNQIYCSQDCKNDANNDKIKTKYHYLKALEKEHAINEQYKVVFKNAIRIVLVEYDEDGNNETILFEKKSFKKDIRSPQLIRQLGLSFGHDSPYPKGTRVAIYIPMENAICLPPNYSSFSVNDGVVYRLVPKKKKPTS
jgi:hypothetical protein